MEKALADAGRGAPFVLLPIAATGMLRIVTNARIFPDPTPLTSALAFLRALIGAPGVALATLGREWPMLEHLCEDHQLSGNDVTDAWIAAAVLDQQEHLVTFDRGFRRMLKPRNLTVLVAG